MSLPRRETPARTARLQPADIYVDREFEQDSPEVAAQHSKLRKASDVQVARLRSEAWVPFYAFTDTWDCKQSVKPWVRPTQMPRRTSPLHPGDPPEPENWDISFAGFEPMLNNLIDDATPAVRQRHVSTGRKTLNHQELEEFEKAPHEIATSGFYHR